MPFSKKNFQFLFLLLSSLGGFAQTNKDDLQAWFGTSLKVNLKHGWDISAQYRLRITDNITYYKGSYLFGQVDKKLNDHFALMTNYRLAMIDKGTYHRFAFGLEAQQKYGIVTVALRPMIQYQKQNFSSDNESSTDTDTYFRPRLTVKSPITKRLDAYIYAEPFYKLDKNPNLDWWQNSVGLKYEYAKRKKINLYYIWQPDYSKKLFRTINIIGLGLDFSIKSSK
jgi:Protein of unknown function (DUF2490)